ncbi:hypothetical protein Gogos_001287 [Gossypium gossypioides]|uniref:MADS-box domain-containing protein n=1 Tax=Gossypium gossypioides TaxID=34282 RepID=A0A7J9CVN5_GOSGO|nr:hypothetical protein [Gossypium gossypioides]
MSRKKIKLAYITNDSARKTTYKKRSKGLVKKVRELTTLCGIEGFTVMNSPDFGSQVELRKLRKENRQKELKEVIFESLSGKGILQSLNAMDLDEVDLLVKQNLTDIDNRVRVLTKASRS